MVRCQICYMYTIFISKFTEYIYIYNSNDEIRFDQSSVNNISVEPNIIIEILKYEAQNRYNQNEFRLSEIMNNVQTEIETSVVICNMSINN